MNKIDRRGFLKTLATGVALLGAPALALGATRQVVVVGGGTGGVSVARALRRADATIAVPLIEPDSDYYTCYMSNEVLGGGRSLASIRFGYAGLQADGIHGGAGPGQHHRCRCPAGDYRHWRTPPL